MSSDSALVTDVIDETVFEIEGGKEETLEWPGHGLRLRVPADALGSGTTTRLDVKALLDGEFELPENTFISY